MVSGEGRWKKERLGFSWIKEWAIGWRRWLGKLVIIGPFRSENPPSSSKDWTHLLPQSSHGKNPRNPLFLYTIKTYTLSTSLPHQQRQQERRRGAPRRPRPGGAAPPAATRGRSRARRPRAGEVAPRRGASKVEGRGTWRRRGRSFLGLRSKLRRWFLVKNLIFLGPKNPFWEGKFRL